MTDITGIKIVEKNAGFSNSLVATWQASDGSTKGVVVAWNVDDYVGNEISLPEGLIPDGVDVAFGVIPNGGSNLNPTAAITDVASGGAAATTFTIEGGPNDVTFNGQAITGSGGADLLLQSEAKNPERAAGEEFGDNDDFSANDESGSDDNPDQEVSPTSATASAGERDLNASPLTTQQFGFEDLADNSDGDFNDLIIEVIEGTTQGSQGNSGTAPAGELAVSLSTVVERSVASFELSGLISVEEVTAGEVNLAIVMDASGSTRFNETRVLGAFGDLNEDGEADELIDAELLAIQNLSDELDGISGFTFNIALIPFANLAETIQPLGPGFDVVQELKDASLLPGFESEVAIGGGTEFEPPLQQAINYFNAVDADQNGTNRVLFLSDGEPFNPTSFLDELETLEDPSGINGIVTGVGFGPTVNELIMDQVDTNGDAIITNDPTGLSDALALPPISPSEISVIELVVNGSVEETFDPNDLTAIPNVGLQIQSAIVDSAILGDGKADLVQLRVEDNDGNVAETGVYVGEIGAAEQYVLTGAEDPVDFIVGFNADQGDELVLEFLTSSLSLIAVGTDGNDFILQDNGTALVEFIDTTGVSGVDDLFGASL